MSNTFQQIGVIVVDIQGDFTELHEGSLAVAGTDEAFIEKIAGAVKELKEAGFPIYGTQDWHPPDHVSFYSNHPGKQLFDVIDVDGRAQVLWPTHCVQETAKAELLIDPELFQTIVQKGQDIEFDSYSGFRDDGGQNTEMDAILKEAGIKTLVIFGVATDYCVKATVVDALAAGYKVLVIEELCRGVAPDTSKAAIEEMEQAGAAVMESFSIEAIKGS